ncbi:hypothetical protein SAMN05660477_00936 [Soonwooa buanensis]|uniref:Regulatory protein, luxR family n=1 Tax=Soonwooa buanensis TaxID=619805 RepID=A0A1T5DR35_9FLAO|nr:hypothetical protein [Soonwooa buanensis]SKB74131.1 hypothetical protein SAMN05660477_00936 [Soonwooa buanensis]
MIKNIASTLITLFLILCSSQIFGQLDKKDEFLEKTRILIVDNKFEEAQKAINKELEAYPTDQLYQVKLYSNFVMLYLYDNNFDKALEYANLIKKIAVQTPDKLDDAYASYCFGRIYLINNLYEKTIYFANEGLKTLEKTTTDNYLKSELYRIITLSYNRQGEYNEEYKSYVLKQLYYIEKTKLDFDINATYTDVMVMYLSAYNKTKQQADLDKAFEYGEKSLNLVNYKPILQYSEQAKATTYNNYASIINQFPYKNYSKEKRRIIAENYLSKAMQIANQIKIGELLMICYTTYSELCQDKSCEKMYLEKAYNIAVNKKFNKKDNIKILLASSLKNIYKSENNFSKALEYSEDELKFTKTSAEKLNNNRKKLIEAYYEVEQKKQQINQLQAANKSSNILKFMFLGMLIFALIGLVFMIYTFRYKQKLNKQKTNILQAEIKESELVLKLEKEEKIRLKTEQDLLSLQQEQLQKQALAVSLQLNHKNTFIKEIKEKLKNNDVNLDRILRDERITENDFAEIKDVVQEVHPNFFKKLNSISKTKLTNLDQKYAAYIYINMDNQKISHILKVDPQTVRVTKYRLKQKLGLDKTQDLQLFLQDLV